MKRNNRKGFTIVELVIVIAVIAILAAVLIPTFSGIIQKAQNSKVVQEANATYKMYIATVDYAEGDTAAQDLVVKVDSKYVAVIDAQMDDTVYTSADDAATAAGISGEYTIIEKNAENVDITSDTNA